MASQSTNTEGASSGSSIGSHGSRRSTAVVQYCHCGEIAPMWTSWSTKNPGRRFIGCPNYRINRYCGFFEWVDPPICDRAKEILRDLRSSMLQCRDAVSKLFDQNIKLKDHVKELEQQCVKMKTELEKSKAGVERRNRRERACWKAMLLFCITLVMVVLSSVN